MAKPIDTAPRLPAGSVDFNKLHDAIKDGKDADAALSAAGAAPLPAADASDTPAPAAADAK